MKQSNNKAKLAIIISMAIWGTIGVFVKNIALGSAEIALLRGALALVFIGGCLLIRKEKAGKEVLKKELPFLFLSGIAMGVNWVLLFQAYRYTSVSIATLSYYFAPVLVTVLSSILFREKLNKKQIFCFLLSTAGVALIIGLSGFGQGQNDGIGILFGLGAACLYASVVLINKFVKEITGLQRTFWQFAAAVVVMIPYVAFTEGFHVMELSGEGIIRVLIVGLVHTGVAYLLYFTALKDVRGQEASILSYVDPFVAVLCSIFILGEEFSLIQAVGGILILGGAIWNERAGK